MAAHPLTDPQSPLRTSVAHAVRATALNTQSPNTVGGRSVALATKKRTL